MSLLDKVKVIEQEHKATQKAMKKNVFKSPMDLLLEDKEIKLIARKLFTIYGKKEEARTKLNDLLGEENRLPDKNGKTQPISAAHFNKLLPTPRKKKPNYISSVKQVHISVIDYSDIEQYLKIEDKAKAKEKFSQLIKECFNTKSYSYIIWVQNSDDRRGIMQLNNCLESKKREQGCDIMLVATGKLREPMKNSIESKLKRKTLDPLDKKLMYHQHTVIPG